MLLEEIGLATQHPSTLIRKASHPRRWDSGLVQAMQSSLPGLPTKSRATHASCMGQTRQSSPLPALQSHREDPLRGAKACEQHQGAPKPMLNSQGSAHLPLKWSLSKLLI
eukprot:gnl/MRDRNA2_/MRDRNA2_82456_c0_seq2.p2 gnl/MRDRNA2_/MRDRNA2_82456_c0~~gnl/MRDRNA2_/MRDRNA2_82456_c0_seq2.p2  ORF type:complete len:110 (-),score=13.04 gnl/MRDRNA2_/MRDRNA2_82456_c0_seq2:385-714(-)